MIRKFYTFILILLILSGCSGKDHPSKELNNTLPPTQKVAKAELTPIVPSSEPSKSVSTPSPVIKQSSLSGRTICIDPGHQAKGNNKLEPDSPSNGNMKAKVSSGTKGVSTGIYEYELNLNVSKKLKSSLEKEGARIIMIRESNDVDISNMERAKLGNEAKADIAVRIHADGDNNQSVKGLTLLYPATSKMGKDIVEPSKKASAIVYDKLVKYTGAKGRGLSQRNDLTGFNWSSIPVILVEMGFMTNPEEDKLLNTDDYQNKIVKAITVGLGEYFK